MSPIPPAMSAPPAPSRKTAGDPVRGRVPLPGGGVAAGATGVPGSGVPAIVTGAVGGVVVFPPTLTGVVVVVVVVVVSSGGVVVGVVVVSGTASGAMQSLARIALPSVVKFLPAYCKPGPKSNAGMMSPHFVPFGMSA